jgi:hypothetical protein
MIEQGGQMGENAKPNLKFLGDKWPSSVVARDQIRFFTGGCVSPRRMANLDSAGEGPKGRIRIGRKIAYPVTELVSWLESRSESVN